MDNQVTQSGTDLSQESELEQFGDQPSKIPPTPEEFQTLRNQIAIDIDIDKRTGRTNYQVGTIKVNPDSGEQKVEKIPNKAVLLKTLAFYTIVSWVALSAASEATRDSINILGKNLHLQNGGEVADIIPEMDGLDAKPYEQTLQVIATGDVTTASGTGIVTAYTENVPYIKTAEGKQYKLGSVSIVEGMDGDVEKQLEEIMKGFMNYADLPAAAAYNLMIVLQNLAATFLLALGVGATVTIPSRREKKSLTSVTTGGISQRNRTNTKRESLTQKYNIPVEDIDDETAERYEAALSRLKAKGMEDYQIRHYIDVTKMNPEQIEELISSEL